TVKAYELGVKSEWLDRRLVANLAGFYSDYSQMQLQITGAPPLHAFANAAKSTIYGAEFETRAAVGEHLRFDASAGYTHTRIEQ
ncbi:TonB-dependent receptor, partial [Acinetobacter baumannii]